MNRLIGILLLSLLLVSPATAVERAEQETAVTAPEASEFARRLMSEHVRGPVPESLISHYENTAEHLVADLAKDFGAALIDGGPDADQRRPGGHERRH